MSRPVKNVWGRSTFVSLLALLLLISPVVRGQNKPTATWVDVDLDRETVVKDGAKENKDLKDAKAIQPVAIKPEKQKSIWHEPAWYVAIGGSVLDIAASASTIDGKRVYESNSLLRGGDGKLALARAVPLTVAGLYLQYKYYKNPKHRKWAIVSMVASGLLHATLGGARALAMK